MLAAEPKIGVGSVEFPGQTLEQVLQNTQAVGATHVELVARGNVFRDRLDEAERLLKRYGITPTAVSAFTRLNLATFGDIRSVQDLINECVDCAQALGAPFTEVYYGVNPAYDRETSIRLFVQNLAPCLDHAVKKGVVLLLENVFDIIPRGVPDSFRDWYRVSDYSRSADGCLGIINAVGSDNFRLNFDACNFYVGGDEPYPYAYELLKQYISNVHLKDARKFDSRLLPEDHRPTLQRDPFGDFACVPLGHGGFNCAGLLRALKRDGYSGVITLEAHNRPWEIMDALKAGAQFIRDQWAEEEAVGKGRR